MKKGFFTLFLTAFSLVAVGAATLVEAPRSQSVRAISRITEAPDFTGEVEYTDTDLSVNATSSSVTDFSSSFQITYSTGGKAICDNALGGNFVRVIGDVVGGEDILVTRALAIHKMSEDDQNVLHEEVAEGIRDTELFDGQIFSFNSQPINVFIPETISRGFYDYNSIFDVTPKSILDHAFDKNANVEKLYIPKTIEIIPEGAFKRAQKLTDIYVEFTEANKPVGWEDGFNVIDIYDEYGEVIGTREATIHWGEEDVYSYVPSSENPEYYRHPSFTQFADVGDDNINFIFGYVPEDTSKGHYPLTIEYKIVGDNAVYFTEIEKTNVSEDYDSVGGKIGTGASSNVYTNSFYIDIEIKHGQQIDFDSIVIHNFFFALQKTEEGRTYFVPDMTRRYFVSPGHAFSRTSSLNDFISTSFNTASAFAGFTSVTANVSKVKRGLEIYKVVKPYYYEKYKDNFANGRAYIRYRFTQLAKATFVVDAGKGEVEIDPETPVIQYIIKKDVDNNIGFVFKNSAMKDSSYSVKNLKSFAVKGMTITIDVVNDGSIIKPSYTRARFGIIYFKTPSDTLKTFNADLFIILLSIGYTAMALLLATTLFFVYKRVYRNDEFKRLKPKQFIIKAIIYWVTSLAIALEIAFVVIRTTVFANAIAVYNPVDIFIIIFGIASVIIIGYFIRNIVIASKARSQRKKAIKLGLLDEVADDGTK